MRLLTAAALAALALPLSAEPETENLVADGIPSIPTELVADAGRYLEFRDATFHGWHPQRREMLITTRFADSRQLHLVAIPGGARKQMTFLKEPVASGSFRPKTGECIVFAQDTGGNENFQFHRLDLTTGKITLLTDGKARHTGAAWSDDGRLLAYACNARNKIDADIWVLDPDKPGERRMVCEVEGGEWSVQDWSPDGKTLLLLDFRSANESHLWLADRETGRKERLDPTGSLSASRTKARFARDGQQIFLASDEAGEFQQLGRMDLAHRKFVVLTAEIPWNVENFDLSPDGQTIAFVTNEDGASRLRFVATASAPSPAPPRDLPSGVIGALKWTDDGRQIGFSMTSARSPADAWAYAPATGELTRWTESEAGGLDVSGFVEPEIVRLKSFDGVTVSGLLYQPDARRFPGPRPIILMVHGGPEGQSRPVFQARNNYFLNEMGIALFYPNVRGSTGYGKTFLTLDDGFKREDSPKDIAVFLDFIATRQNLDASRVAVMGGSYGGYMTLACMIRYADRLRCGCDIVGISNFHTFLTNTSGYRRDLRRHEYGDERDAKMAAFLKSISPTAHADKITKPLYVVQGLNDPRVPASEAAQMVKAVRAGGTPVWYLLAKDEGHGFRKKGNADFQFLSTVMFFREHL
jgi:dipeptidyl aminopeptidase/acylaminoacyl peptidase